MTRKSLRELMARGHPFQTYLFALAFLSGVPLIFGQSNSDAVTSALPPPLVTAWGLMLVLGSAMSLVGIYWAGREDTALIIERTGAVGVGGAALIYAAIVVLYVGVGALFTACITTGFALACFAQARRISRSLAFMLAEKERLSHE